MVIGAEGEEVTDLGAGGVDHGEGLSGRQCQASAGLPGKAPHASAALKSPPVGPRVGRPEYWRASGRSP